MIANEEISLLLSSDPQGGAINRSPDGSYFEVQLQDGIKVPEKAINCQLSCESAEVWYTIPNVTSENNKLYVTGPSGRPEEKDKVALEYPVNSTYSMNIITQYPDPPTSLLEFNVEGGPSLPIGPWQVGDTFRPDDGVESGFLYVITEIQSETNQTQTYIVSGLLEQNLTASTGPFTRLRNDIVQNYELTIPNGLYDLSGLNQAILRELENAGAKTDPSVLFSLSPDEPTNKVEIRFNYDTVSIDFTRTNTLREIMGFNSEIIGPYPTVPFNRLADNVARFNSLNFLIIHSDLTPTGIRFNNTYNQALCKIQINVSPGSQILYNPYNPAKIQVPDMIGAIRSTLRMWITDQNNNRIDTNGEYWSARLVLRYQMPYYLR